MRRVLLVILILVLGALVAARAMLPTPAEEAAAMATVWDSGTNNVLALDLPYTAQTAGSARIAELNSYFLTCLPTAKTGYTGLFAGKDLILLLAEDWKVDAVNRVQTPVLYRLWSEGAHLEDVYAPEWYQQMDGREFALLTGLTPTAVQDGTAMVWAGQQGIYLPFALGTCLGQAGYTCRVCGGGPERAASYRALGFEPAGETPEQTVQTLAAAGQPFAVYCVLSGGDGEAALSSLWTALEDTGRLSDMLVAVVTGSSQPLRGHIFLWGEGLRGVSVAAPCSELDVTATVLDLLGAAYDSRFLAGRDLLAGDRQDVPVALYGSAFSDWVTPAGSYIAGEERFFPVDARFSTEQETARYVRQMRRAVYDRYSYDRQAMESNYFRVVMGR